MNPHCDSQFKLESGELVLCGLMPNHKGWHQWFDADGGSIEWDPLYEFDLLIAPNDEDDNATGESEE